MAEKTRYSDDELQEFKEIINEKLKLARRDFTQMMEQLRNADNNGVDDIAPTYKTLEEAALHSQRKRLPKWQTVSRSLLQVLRPHLCALRTRHME